MKNKALRSFLLLACIPVLMLVMLSPAYAITTTVKPDNAINGTLTDAYTATLDPAGASADIFILNITIPVGYQLKLPAVGKTVGNYIMFDIAQNKNKVFINITSADTPDGYLVDVTYSTDFGATSTTNASKNITNISIGVATLNITKPTNTTAGYLNISLAGAGPIDPSNNRVTITLANGTLINPDTVGTYTWVLAAKNDPTGAVLFTKSNDVSVAAGASSATTVPVFNATIPANASLALPSGNLTVNITAGAGVNVTDLVVTLRNFTSDPNPSATAGASGLSRLLFIGVDAPALSGVSFSALLRVNYSSVLSSLTTPEANLKLYRFNVTSSAWEITSNSGVDTSNTTVYGTTTAFSTFAIMGASAAAASSVSGGGGGGGGVVTGESFDNIAKSESYDKDLIANTPVTYTFKAPELGVYEIAFTDKENENGITLRVEALKGTSKQVTTQAPGTVYKNINILTGTQRMKEALIRFKVENSWLGSNNQEGSDVKLVTWDGSQWVQLETAVKNKDDTYTYYEAMTNHFSAFAITGLKGVAVPTATPALTPTPTLTSTPTAVPTEEVKEVTEVKSILSITLIILVIITAILVAVYLSRRGKK